MTISDLYIQLFGKGHIKDGTVIDMAEHGRAGGVSTGQGFKFSKDVEEKTIIDEVDNSTTYIGKAKMGALTGSEDWQIKRISINGTETSISFANGDTTYNKEWDERANYSYS